jgi:hypothetical protein
MSAPSRPRRRLGSSEQRQSRIGASRLRALRPSFLRCLRVPGRPRLRHGARDRSHPPAHAAASLRRVGRR